MRAYFAGRPWLDAQVREDGFNAVYANELTGVYCSFDHDEAGLCFTVNLNRPTFFARESLGLVGEICAALDLLVVDLQADDSEARAYDHQRLEASWIRTNEWAVEGLRGQGAPGLYLEREAAFEWWRYAQVQPELDARFVAAGEDVFVPKRILAADAGTNLVRRAVAWTGTIPLVVPPCDVVILKRRRGLIRRGAGQRVADAQAVLGVIGAALEPLDDDFGSDARLLPAGAAADPELQGAVAALGTTPLDPTRFRGICPEEFVDVPL